VNGAPSAMVSPGLWGFLAFFVLAVALYLLMRNMNARMRRMTYRSQALAREAQEQEAARRDRSDDRSPDNGKEPPQAQQGQADEPAP
jgi:hypothetical protein